MKVLGIMCSPRRGGNTEILLQAVLDSAQEAGAEVEMIRLAGKSIAPCDGCLACEKTGACHIKDDMQEMAERMVAADALLIGTPVYWLSVNAQAKALIDRTYSLYVSGRKLRGKLGGAVVTATREGCYNAISLLNGFFISHRMLVVGWTLGYGHSKGEVRQDSEAAREARNLGKAIVRQLQQWEKAAVQ